MTAAIAEAMAGAAAARQAAATTREGKGQESAGHARRNHGESWRAQREATSATAAEPAPLDTLGGLQQLADASPRVAQLRRLQGLADASPQVVQLRRLQALADSRYAPVAQLAGGPEEEEPFQGQFATAVLPRQLQQAPRAHNTGLPDQLKSGIESLSGVSMDDVRVHYNSSQPAQLNALAYAQGSDIHLAPGQEQHLPHEAWHVVQQRQGRVRETVQMAGVGVNDDAALEREADAMGAQAARQPANEWDATPLQRVSAGTNAPVQRSGKGIAGGMALGAGIGALGFFAGPLVGGITTAIGAVIGGIVGHLSSIVGHLKGTIPGTRIQIFSPSWEPFSTKRFLVDANNSRLGLQLTTDTLNQVLAVLAKLQLQGVANIDDLVHGLDNAVKLAIPLDVALNRLQLIHNNLQSLVLTRIQDDHAEIAGMYPAGTLDPVFKNAFKSIEIPGSDPHKGGQVVVFINYQTMAGQPLRVVYKPSDLKMDMLLYNDDKESVAATLGAGVASYRMMSMHDAEAQAVDLRKAHYGYMKFVESGSPQNAEDMVSVFTSLGANLAVAYVFGLRDIHHENIVLQNNRIQFIDMEAATGTFGSFRAMELQTFPNALCAKIGKGLVGMANNVVQDWLPDDAALTAAVRHGFTNTLNQMQTGGPNDAAIDSLVTTASQARTRFVPFPTAELQLLAGLFHGELAAPTAETMKSFNDATTRLAKETAAAANDETTRLAKATAENVNPAAIEEDFKIMLRAQTTKDALNVGDVPCWTRQGNTIYGEDGTLQIAALAHPRLDTEVNIRAGANNRRTLGEAEKALNLLDEQFMPMLNGIRGKIIIQHQIQRHLLGHRPPGY